LIRRIATFGLGISPPPKRGDGSRHYLPLSSDAEADQGAENAEIRCRIGAKSGAAFRRNHLPLSTEIQCRFAPIFAINGRNIPVDGLEQPHAPLDRRLSSALSD
jgi:hypothetical protein